MNKVEVLCVCNHVSLCEPETFQKDNNAFNVCKLVVSQGK